jgi:O-antigen biosynthesis protein
MTGTVPMAVRILDLDRPLREIVPAPAPPYRSALLIVRLHGAPLGIATISLEPGGDGLAPARLAEAVREQLGRELEEAGIDVRSGLPADRVRVAEPPAPSRVPEPAVTVVVPTCRRPEALRRCLESILACDYPRFDVIVVENRPGSAETARVLAERFAREDRLQYLEELRRGSSHARNAGLRRASGEIVAFVDDDVVVDERWLRAAVAGFSRAPDIGCVTGMIAPLRLDTRAQALLEQLASFGKGFRPLRFGLPESRVANPLFPYTAGHIGSGANMLVRAGLARDLGGFDTRLGPGTPAHGGEELDFYIRAIRSGASIAYEPAAIVWHEHPAGWEQLQRHAFRYGIGLTAMLTKQLVAGPERLRMLSLVPAGVRYAFDPRSRKNASKTPAFPRRLNALERAGMLLGPAAFVRSAAVATGRREAR